MIITCPKCKTKYNIDSALIPTSGKKMRCAKCGEIWKVYPENQLPPENQEPTVRKVLGTTDKTADMAKASLNTEPVVTDQQEMNESFEADKTNDNSEAEVKMDDVAKVEDGLAEGEEVTKKTDAEGDDTASNSFDGTDNAAQKNCEKAEEANPDKAADESKKAELAVNENSSLITGGQDDQLRNESQNLEASSAEADDLVAENHTDVNQENEQDKREAENLADENSEAENLVSIPVPQKKGGANFLFSLLKVTMFLLFLLALVFAYAFRYEIVKEFPESEIVYEKLGLDYQVVGEGLVFEDVIWNEYEDNDVPKMDISGIINNKTDKILNVPLLHIELLDRDGNILQNIDRTLSTEHIVGGGSVDFKTTIVRPAPFTKYIYVTFNKPK